MFVLAMGLSACSPVSDNPDALPANVADFPPMAGDRLLPGDTVEVKFYYTPELNERETIRPDGMISLGLIPDVNAAGMTIPELRMALVKAYSTQLVSPDLTVLLREQPSNRVFIAGEVGQSGPQSIVGGLTVSRAIALAQGMKTTAYGSQVLVIRTGPDGKRQVRVVDMDGILHGSADADAQDVALQPFDLVFVPRSPIADVDLFVDQYIRKVLPVTPTLGVQFQ
jgi:polysaccharide biosynthesis/export protein